MKFVTSKQLQLKIDIYSRGSSVSKVYFNSFMKHTDAEALITNSLNLETNCEQIIV